MLKPQYWDKGHLSFSGSGFIGIYHVGVVLAFKQFAPHIASRKALGTSSGALATTCVVAGFPIYRAIDSITKMAIHGRSLLFGPLNPRFNIGQIMRSSLEQYLPADAHERCSGRMFISATRASTLRNEVFSEYESRQEIVEVLLASCFIPYVLGIVAPKVRGASYLDGGITDNLPVHDENTITVSPFAGIACIRPLQKHQFLPDVIYTPDNAVRLLRTVFSPKPQALENLCEQGYEDAIRFIRKNNLYACPDCAQQDQPERRGACAACNALFVTMESAKIDQHYLMPLKLAQQAEDELAAEAASQRSALLRTIDTFKAMAYSPVGATLAVTQKTFDCWDELKRSLRNCYTGMWNSALMVLWARQNATMCGGPTTALEPSTSNQRDS